MKQDGSLLLSAWILVAALVCPQVAAADGETLSVALATRGA